MSDLAVAVIVGRLTRDAELKYTNSGQAICHFSVATSARRKKDDQWVEESSFWDVDLWGKLGETINQYLMILLEFGFVEVQQNSRTFSIVLTLHA